MCSAWRADTVIVDESGTCFALAQDLRKRGAKAFPISSGTAKEERLAAGFPLVHEGRVRVPREAPWLEEFFSNLRKFPNGRHDDQVDTLLQFLNLLLLPRMDGIVGATLARSRGEIPRRETHTWHPRKSLREHIPDSYDRDAPSLPVAVSSRRLNLAGRAGPAGIRVRPDIPVVSADEIMGSQPRCQRRMAPYLTLGNAKP
jgi:hypothetical protein